MAEYKHSVYSLEHLSRVTISVNILRSINFEHALNYDLENWRVVSTGLFQVLSGVAVKEKEVLFVEELASKIWQLPLPDFILKECYETVQCMGLATIKYFQNLPLNSVWMTIPYDSNIYFATLEWSGNGVVDEVRTARNILNRPFKNPKLLFEVACNYCLQDLVTKLWTPNKVSKPNYKRLFLSQTTFKPIHDYNFATYYWHHRMLNKMDTFENALIKNHSGKTLYEILCLWSIGQCNSFAFEYFWSKMPQEERVVLIQQMFMGAVRHNLNPKTTLYLFKCLSQEQIASVASERLFYEDLLPLTLNYPYQDYFPSLFTLCCKNIPEYHYKFLLLELSTKVSMGIMSSTYRSLFELVWTSSPTQVKTSIIENHNVDFPLFWKIFSNVDIGVLEIVLKDCSEGDLLRIFFNENGLREMKNLLLFKDADPEIIMNMLTVIFKSDDLIKNYQNVLLKSVFSTATTSYVKKGKLNVQQLDKIFKAFATPPYETVNFFKTNLVNICPITVFEVISADLTDYNLQSLSDAVMWFFPNEEEYAKFKKKIVNDKYYSQNVVKKLFHQKQIPFLKLFLNWCNIPHKQFNRDFMLSKDGIEFMYSLGLGSQLKPAIDFLLTDRNLLFEFTNRFQEYYSWNSWHKEPYKCVWRILEHKSSRMK